LPEPLAFAERRETRTSWVFLTSERVYKLKKPLAEPGLNFSTVEARHRNAELEVTLNRRLAPDVYLGIEPLVEKGDGRLGLGGAGRVVDWLVVMRRLPERRLLDHAIADHSVTHEAIDAVAGAMVRFYRGLPAEAVTPEDYVEAFATEIEESRRLLRDDRLGLDPRRIDGLANGQRRFLDGFAGAVGQRAARMKLVEGHGDLRPEHVCLTDPPCIIDCLEFDRRLRIVDPFDEMSALAMDCERLGAAWIGPRLVEALKRGLSDDPPDSLLCFYRTVRACMRARFALRHLLEPVPREPAKWRPLADRYLALAERDAGRLV
jgi:aminoglycoside phosphotransferase family enzyme